LEGIVAHVKCEGGPRPNVAPRSDRLMPQPSPGPALVIFDCDGVLIDSELIGCRAEAAELARTGIAISADEILARFTGISSKAMYATLEAELGRPLPPDLEARIAARIRADFERELAPVSGIHAALDRLRCAKCVASSSDPARLDHSLTLTGLLERFAPHIFSATMVRHGKPAPDLFLFAAQAMKVAPAECLVVEDSEAGVQAALAAGMRVLGFTGGSHCGPEHAARLLAAGASLVFADMARLPGLIDGAAAAG
jgi:HAD superfamily hydrolase (TIGR01509 family)